MSQQEKLNKEKLAFESGKEKSGLESAKEKGEYMKEQATDKAKEAFYGAKQDIREVGQDIKEKFQSDRPEKLPE